MRWLWVLVVLIGVVGCVARPTPAKGAPEAAVATAGAESTPDPAASVEAYKAAVEERARRRHVKVYWVNPPGERQVSDAQDVLRRHGQLR